MWGRIIGGAASLIGGAMSSRSAKSAAGAQQQSVVEATAEQRRQYDLTRQDNAPFRNTGVAGNKRLAYLMGLDVPGDSAGGTTTQSGESEAAIRARFAPQFTTTSIVPGSGGGGDMVGDGENNANSIGGGGDEVSTVNEAGLNAAVQAELQRQAAVPTERGADFGSLMRKFSLADRDSDPVYQSGLQFGLDQGRDAINARAIAGGRYDSGATLKALTRFGNDYGSTKAEGSYNRFNTDNTNIYNRLAGISGTGQTATNAISSAGQNMSNNVSELMTQGGNARAAGIVGGANAWNNAFGGVNDAYNNYQSGQRFNQLMDWRRGGGGSSGSSNYGGYNQGAGDLNYGIG